MLYGYSVVEVLQAVLTLKGTVPTWLGILLSSVFAFYLYNTWRFGEFKKLGINGPRPWPVIGSMWLMMSKGIPYHDTEMMRKYGKVVGTFLGREPFLLIYDVDMLKQILIKEFNSFQERMVPGVVEYPLSKMLPMLKGDHWKHVRGVVSPTFSSGKLRRMNQQINKCAESLIKALDDKARMNEVFEFTDMCGAYTMDVIASTAFGIQINSHEDPNNPFVTTAKTFFVFKFTSPKTIFMLFFPFLVKPLTKYFGFTIFPKDCVNFFVKVVDKAFEERGKETALSKPTDFLQLLVNAKENDADDDDAHAEKPTSRNLIKSNKGLSHEEVLAQSLIFFFAGYETTANTLSLFAYCLATNPECQQKLIKEIDDIIKGEELITYDLVQKLPYMDMCLNEVLRIYPAAARTDRVATSDVTINGVFIPKGMSLGIPIYVLQMDPEIWPEPEKFNPDRFSTSEKEGRNAYNYIPFSTGPRNCVGMRLALMELKIAMVHILQKFKFVKCLETEVPLKLKTMAMKAENGIKLKVARRSF